MVSYTQQTQEMEMYGMLTADIHSQLINGITAKSCGLEMVVAGILSDAQQLSESRGGAAREQIRKKMNLAKFILFEMMDAKR